MPMKLLRTAAALTVTGLACATLVAGTGVAAAAAGPVLNGPQRGLAAEGSAVTISGTAPVGSTVDIWFHRRNPHVGPQVYVKRRSLPVGADGRFRTTYVAKDDYRYYAQVGSVKSSVHLTQVPVQITMTQVPVWIIMTQVPGRIRRSGNRDANRPVRAGDSVHRGQAPPARQGHCPRCLQHHANRERAVRWHLGVQDALGHRLPSVRDLRGQQHVHPELLPA
jgi:hypothetical protein